MICSPCRSCEERGNEAGEAEGRVLSSSSSSVSSEAL
jgi:hypothetical protein